MHRLSRKNQIELAVMTVIFVIAAVLVYRTTILTRMVLPRTVTQVEADAGCDYKVMSEDHIEQQFFYSSDELLSVGTTISLNEDAVGNLVSNEKNTDLGVLHLDVLDESGASVMNADYAVYALEDGQNLFASLPGMQTGFANSHFTLVIDAENINEETGLAIGCSKKQKKNTALTINGEAVSETINIKTADHQFMYWKKWSVFGAGLIYLLLVGTYFLLAVFRKKTENVFLFSGAVLAVIYLLLLPPMSVPDEEVHFKAAYTYANQLMGKDTEAGRVLMDKEDYQALKLFKSTPSLSEYDTLKENIGKSGRIEGTKEVHYSDTQAPAVTYLPGIIGIVIGRLLGLNGILVIVLGRLCSILFYLFTMYWFIRLMPCGKAAAFIIAILPMTIQQCCSYSYDSVVIEVVFLYLAVLFGLLYRKEKIQRYHVVLYVIFMIIMAMSKGGTYMPLCLLTIMIPADRFKDKKQKWIFTGSMATIAVVAFLSSTLSYVLYVASPTAEQAATSYLEGEAYGAAGLLEDPMNFICLLTRILFLSGDGFVETMLGMQLSWLNVFVSRIVIYGMLFMMILSIQQVKEKDGSQFEVTTVQKVSYAVCMVLSAGMVFVSMFMSWTPKNSTAIAGVQGRYFLPLLPVFLLLFYNRNLIQRKDMDRKYMYIAVCLQCVAVYGILLSLERVL